MKGKIFAMLAVFVMTAFVFSAIGVSALEERPSSELPSLPSIPIPGPTHWYTSLDGNAKIIGQGKPAEGTAYTDAIHTCDIPCSGIYNRIAIVIGEDTYRYGLNIEAVTYTSNTLTIEATEGCLHGKLISTETSVYPGDPWSATCTKYTVADMHGTLTLDGMKVKLQDMSGTVAHQCWYYSSGIPHDILHDQPLLV